MNKKIFYLLLISFVLLLINCSTVKFGDLEKQKRSAGWNSDPYVQLDSGFIQGQADKENTWSWKGIPYAQPPVANLRWKAPVPVEPWSGIKKTIRFGNKAIQIQSIFTGFVVGSEDCLTLNVWRPKTIEEDLPVYVWIHGGGNSIGSSELKDYWGQAVASRSNAVFVSINYRLGPFGWLKHPLLETDNEFDNSGNFGLLDILSGLQWIQTNIRSFGGNPENVTLSGESAGACNTLALIQSPLSIGLFHKAIIQSGYKKSVSVAQAEKQADELIDYLLVKNKLDRAQLSDDEIKSFLMESKPIDIIRFYDYGNTGMINHLYHIQDGIVFPENGYQSMEQGIAANPVPMIIGSNKDETKLFLFFSNDISWKSDLYEIVARLGSLDFKETGVDSIASQLSGNEHNPAIFVYRFDWGTEDSTGNSPLPGNWGPRIGAFHTLEIPFFLGSNSINGALFTSLLFNRKNKISRDILTGEIMAYVKNFIHSDDPNVGRDMNLYWPQWDNQHQYITFNTNENELSLSISNKISTKEILLVELTDRVTADQYRQVLEVLKW